RPSGARCLKILEAAQINRQPLGRQVGDYQHLQAIDGHPSSLSAKEPSNLPPYQWKVQTPSWSKISCATFSSSPPTRIIARLRFMAIHISSGPRHRIIASLSADTIGSMVGSFSSTTL